jgi:ABC-type branched-subunit amino acid transport system substrate-binding protein
MAAGTKKLVELGKLPQAKKVALLIYNSGVAQIVQDEMNKRFPENGFEIVATEVYEPTATDITVQLEKLRAADPDIIMLSAVGPGVVTAMTGLRDIGWDDAVVMADASSALQDLDKQLPPENKANFYFPMLTPVTRDGDTATSDIIQKLEAVGPIESLFVSTLTHDIATWAAWAINKAGAADGESVAAVLEGVGDLPESELPQNRALKINPGYSPDNHSLGGGDLSHAFSLAYVGPLVSGTFPKLADLTIPAKVA